MGPLPSPSTHMPENFAVYDDDKAIGVDAPKIGDLRFLQGEKVELGTGKVCVVIFLTTYAKDNFPNMTELSELSKQYPDVAFTGVLVDPLGTREDPKSKATVMNFLNYHKDDTIKRDPTAEPPHIAFPIAYDPTKEYKNKWQEDCKQAAIDIPTAFIVGKDGKILWREKFGQYWPVKKSKSGVGAVFPEQLALAAEDKPMASQGNRPKVEGEDEEEEAEGDFDMGF